MKYLKLFEDVYDEDYYKEVSQDEYREKLLGKETERPLDYIRSNWEDFDKREIEEISNTFTIGKEIDFVSRDRDYIAKYQISFSDEHRTGTHRMSNNTIYRYKDSIPNGILYVDLYMVSKDKTKYINQGGYEKEYDPDTMIVPYCAATILKLKDSWYYVGFDGCDSIYKCDQWDGVLKCIEDKYETL